MTKKFFIRFTTIFLTLLLLTSFLFALPRKAKAEDDVSSPVVNLDESNVLDDLSGMTVDGKKFSLEDYNFDTSKKTQIITFVEYGYSFYEEKQDAFGLYVYIYNPKGLKFDAESEMNKIQFATTKEVDSSYEKYNLTYLNKTEALDYYGLFYKYKVNLTEEQKTAILNGVNSSSRIYKVSGFELVLQGALNATEFPVSLTYKFSGYTKGCGPNENAESTLKITSEGLETLPLDVHSTTYRPDGTNGKNDYTQDSLHSVYFAVPNKFIEKYGEMVAIHATWLDAVLKPALVTGNQGAYNAILNYLGQNLSIHNEDLNYVYYGAFSGGNSIPAQHTAQCGFSFNCPWNGNYTYNAIQYSEYGSPIDALYLMFDSGSSTDSADDYFVSPEEIKDKIVYMTAKLGGTKVLGKYSKSLFSSVATEFTEKNIYADEKFPLNSFKNVVGDGWWEKLWGITVSKDYSDAFDNIQAIYPIKKSDLDGKNEEVSDRLFISERNVNELKNFYNKDENKDSTIYLFRYQVTDFISQEATLFEESSNFLGAEVWKKVDSNAYFFQETVNLDFDIIDVTFSTGEVETVMPVVSSPIDVVPEGTPPVYTKSDRNIFKLIIMLIILAFVVAVFWPILYPIFCAIFKGIFFVVKIILKATIWLILLPFKLISFIVKKIKTKRASTKKKIIQVRADEKNL